MWPIKNLPFNIQCYINYGFEYPILLRKARKVWSSVVYGWQEKSLLPLFINQSKKIASIVSPSFASLWLFPKRRLFLAVFFDQLAVSRYRSVIKPFD